jgi:hypothetical protein
MIGGGARFILRLQQHTAGVGSCIQCHRILTLRTARHCNGCSLTDEQSASAREEADKLLPIPRQSSTIDGNSEPSLRQQLRVACAKQANHS